MKFLKIGACLVLLGTLGNSMDIKYYVGAGLGHSYWRIKGTVTKISTAEEVSTKFDDDAGLFELQGGAIINKKHKLYLTYDKVNTDNKDIDLNIFSLNYDYMFSITNLKKFKTFIGGSYSLIKYKETLKNDSTISWDKKEAKLNTNAISLKLGCSYSFNNHHSIIFDYLFSIYTNGDETVGATVDSEKYKIKVEVDRMSKFVFSYNYSF